MLVMCGVDDEEDDEDAGGCWVMVVVAEVEVAAVPVAPPTMMAGDKMETLRRRNPAEQ